MARYRGSNKAIAECLRPKTAHIAALLKEKLQAHTRQGLEPDLTQNLRTLAKTLKSGKCLTVATAMKSGLFFLSLLLIYFAASRKLLHRLFQ